MNDDETNEITASIPGDWKKDLKDSLNAMVDSLPQDLPQPAASLSDQSQQEPTLEEFYRALIALEANTRKNVQKTNASLDLVAKGLRGLQVQITNLDERIAKDMRNEHESLINLNGQFLRMLESLQSPPAPALLGLSRKWETAWSDLGSGVEILHRSIIKIFDEYGISVETPAIGSKFDPYKMEAIKVKSTGNNNMDAIVIAVVEPSYHKDGTLIRSARVYVEK